ncbi:MAG: LacI family DNA-binding transcriptional regulator [Clostridia bacterium]|nr:LacI family DNA-binding transcriptional regulator [Clostridia bacterium]
MTYRKIAQIAGVSLSTVSKVLSGSSEISKDTAERVRRIAEEYGVVRPKYRHDRPNIRIAILVPEIISIYYSQKVTEIINEMERLDIEPCIYIVGFSNERFHQIVEQIVDEGRINGILSLDHSFYAKIVEIPFLYLCQANKGPRHDTLWADLNEGVYEAIEYLTRLGHQRIGFIGEKNTSSKLEYFKSAVSRLGLEINPKDIFISDKRFEEIGYEGAAYFAKRRERPTALLAAYDEVALGAIHAFKNYGISVPDDISIIGINDIPFSSYADVPLTTIRTYNEELTHLAVKMLLDKIKQPDQHPVQHIAIQCELVVRDTTARVKVKSEKEQ